MQQETAPTKVNVFDEAGQTVEVIDETPVAVEDVAAPAAAETTEARTDGIRKYRIGDRLFETQDAALEYAQSQVSALETETQVANAYRQGIRDGMVPAAQPQIGVTPATPVAPTTVPEEFYTNPQAYLDKFGRHIQEQTTSALEQKLATQRESDRIWNEFVTRQPMLSEFRNEVEAFVEQNTAQVRAVAGTKGMPAAYDFVATKIKSRFEAYANAVKPTRELPNGGAGASPAGSGPSVTPPATTKKPLSMNEQLRSIRKRR